MDRQTGREEKVVWDSDRDRDIDKARSTGTEGQGL